MKGDEETQSPSPGKVPRRKYKRHPKPDPNAPERPLTAYVRFSKDKRKEYQDRRLSFSELAKQIGLDWQDLSPSVKNRYLNDAASDWTEFRKALEEYHATEQYAGYIQYLRDFASENPESNVKLPHLDLGTSPVQASSSLWGAEGSPTSDGIQDTILSLEPRSGAQGHSDMDVNLHFQRYGQHERPPAQQYNAGLDYGQMDGLHLGNQNRLSGIPTSQDFSAPQNLALPEFSNPWQTQTHMSLNAIGPGSRYSRGNMQLNQALTRASDAHTSGTGPATSGSAPNSISTTKPSSSPLSTLPSLDFSSITGANDGLFPNSVQNYDYSARSFGEVGESQGFHANHQGQQLRQHHLPSQYFDEISAPANNQDLLEFDIDILDETFQDFVGTEHRNA